MFAAVKVYKDFNHRTPPRVEQDGLRFVSEYFGKCSTYVKEHRDEFLEMHGHCFPAVVSFAPTDFPKTWNHHKKSPTLCICSSDEAERMAANIVRSFESYFVAYTIHRLTEKGKALIANTTERRTSEEAAA